MTAYCTSVRMAESTPSVQHLAFLVLRTHTSCTYHSDQKKTIAPTLYVVPTVTEKNNRTQTSCSSYRTKKPKKTIAPKLHVAHIGLKTLALISQRHIDYTSCSSQTCFNLITIFHMNILHIFRVITQEIPGSRIF
jgi:hypothetical protein